MTKVTITIRDDKVLIDGELSDYVDCIYAYGNADLSFLHNKRVEEIHGEIECIKHILQYVTPRFINVDAIHHNSQLKYLSTFNVPTILRGIPSYGADADLDYKLIKDIDHVYVPSSFINRPC